MLLFFASCCNVCVAVFLVMSRYLWTLFVLPCASSYVHVFDCYVCWVLLFVSCCGVCVAVILVMSWCCGRCSLCHLLICVCWLCCLFCLFCLLCLMDVCVYLFRVEYSCGASLGHVQVFVIGVRSVCCFFVSCVAMFGGCCRYLFRVVVYAWRFSLSCSCLDRGSYCSLLICLCSLLVWFVC